MSYIWYEKYRPHSLEEMELTPKQHELFNGYIEDNHIPHLLFYGPPGGGKTTVALILMDLIPNQSLRLNASSERSIDIMRDQVQKFASSQPLPGKQKIVFMDEADGLLAASQKQLRGMIEKYANSCSFIFTANYPEKIALPILSRFIQVRFKGISKGTIAKHLSRILYSEKVKFSIKDLNTVIDLYFPDIRTIINSLQMCSVGGELDLSHINKLEDSVYSSEISAAISSGNLRKIRELVAGNHDFQEYYRYLFNDFIFTVPDDLKPSIAITIAEAMYRDVFVIDKEINFSAMCVELMHLLKCNKIQW